MGIGWNLQAREQANSTYEDPIYSLSGNAIPLKFKFDSALNLFPRTDKSGSRVKDNFVEFAIYNNPDTDFQKMKVSLDFNYNNYNWFSELHIKVKGWHKFP